ncbi:MAG: hypothetical protein ACJZ12_00725 [Candidatus Neomarinimicrobiota bacterium]
MNKLITFYFFITFLSAQWSSDILSPQFIGNGIMPQVASTSNNGVYVAWLTDGNYHIYVQRFDQLGIPQFGDSGILISDNDNASWIAVYHLNIIVDGNDNLVISTVDQRTGNWEVYAWKLNLDGLLLWGEDGLVITDESTSNMSPRLTIADDNSVIVTSSHNDGEVLFQRISPDGQLLWNQGIIKSDDTMYLISPQSIVNNDGELIFQWLRQSSGWPIYSDILVQKYDIDGNPLWTDPVIVVGPVSFPMGNWSQQLISNSEGGSITAWTELVGNVQNAIVESIDESGGSLWSGGIDFSDNSNNFRMSPILTLCDSSRDVVSVWREANGIQSQRGLFAQRINHNGIKLWGDDGVEVVEMNDSYDYLDISISSFNDDVIITYLEQSSNMIGDIFSKKLDSLGNPIWDDIGILTSSNTPKQDLATGKGENCLFVSWSENDSIFVHCLRDDGTLGPPDIISPEDCDSGFVDIEGHCFYENDLSIIQRMIDNSYASGIDLECDDGDDYCGSPNPFMDNQESWFWKIIDGEEFNFADGDGLVEPLELGIQEWEDGRLKSIMCGVYIYCQLSGSIPENIGELTELEQFRFEGNYLSSSVPESICELHIDFEDNLAFDIRYNLLCPLYPNCIQDNIGEQDTSNCEDLKINNAMVINGYELRNAYPNPFNPVTTLEYYLPQDSFVHIEIYDMLGRLVKVLVNHKKKSRIPIS